MASPAGSTIESTPRIQPLLPTTSVPIWTAATASLAPSSCPYSLFPAQHWGGVGCENRNPAQHPSSKPLHHLPTPPDPHPLPSPSPSPLLQPQ